MDVTPPLDNLGAAGICIAVVAFIVIMTIWGMRTEERKMACPTRTPRLRAVKAEELVGRPSLAHDQAVRNFVGVQPVSPYGMQVGVEHLLVPQVNRVLRHCRIGKIILKERA